MLMPNLMEETYPVSYRFDNEPATEGVYQALKNNHGVFLPTQDFLSRTGGTVTIRAKGIGTPQELTSTFNLTGITDTLSKLPCVKKANE
jgi:hypothetical protein